MVKNWLSFAGCKLKGWYWEKGKVENTKERKRSDTVVDMRGL